MTGTQRNRWWWLRFLMRPFIALLNLLRLPMKLGVLGAVFLSALGFVFSRYEDKIGAEIAFNEAEYLGVPLVRPIPALMRALQQHRANSQSAIAAGGSSTPDLDKAASEADAALAATARAIRETGLSNSTRLQQNSAAIAKTWSTLKPAALSLTADESFAQHSALIAAVVQLVSDIGDDSNLTLDPEVATYYLMSAALFRLPPLWEELAKTRDGGVAALTRLQAAAAAPVAEAVSAEPAAEDTDAGTSEGEVALEPTPPAPPVGLTPEEHDRILLNLAAARTYLGGLSGDLERVKNAAPNIDLKALSAATDATAAAVETVLNTASTEVLGTATPTIDPNAFAEAVSVGLAAAYVAEPALLEMLDALLAERIARLVGERQQSRNAVALAVFLSLVLFVAFIFTLREAVGHISRATEKLTAGEFPERVAVEGRDELAGIGHRVEIMSKRLRESIQAERVEAARNLRIRYALDGAKSNVMIADPARALVYLNHNMQKTLRTLQPELAKAMPGFDADKLIGTCIDRFHKSPTHQAGILQNLKGMHEGTIKIGAHTFTVQASPVFSDTGERLGTVAEWIDRTAELALENQIENEVGGIIREAARGILSSRVPLAGKTGFFKRHFEGINALLDTTVAGLDDVSSVMAGVAAGDLTRRIKRAYEGNFGALRDSVNQSLTKLAASMQSVRDSVETLDTAAREISAGNDDLSQRTEQQAANLQETSASMHELANAVASNSKNTQEARGLANMSREITERGSAVVQQVVVTMGAISLASTRIEDIIGTIDGIAFQTNILALNAAVEAARAGEQGRGFAVVASEVRALAQRSADAAKEIKSLIGDSVEKVGTGGQLVQQAGANMTEVTTSVKRLADIIAEISAQSAVQSAGVTQVNQTVSELDGLTQQNSALVEEMTAAARSLSAQASKLAEGVAAFKV